MLSTQLYSQTKSIEVLLTDGTTRHYLVGELTELTFEDDPCDGVKTLSYLGNNYSTEQIGTQCWLTQNLDVGTYMNSITGGTNLDGNQTDNGTIEKYCYNNDSTLCDTFGGLYQWDEAMKYSPTEGAQGICPTDWHIPSSEELNALLTAVNQNGYKLKAIGQGTALGAGTNTSGFSALLTDAFFAYDSSWSGLGSSAVFWSSTTSEFVSTFAVTLYLSSSDDFTFVADIDKPNGFSVRCLKD